MSTTEPIQLTVEQATQLFLRCDREVRSRVFGLLAIANEMGIGLDDVEVFRSGVHAGFFTAIKGVLAGEIDIEQISESVLHEACGPGDHRIG